MIARLWRGWVPTEWIESHPNAPFSFVTEGVGAAVAKAQQEVTHLVFPVVRS